MIYILLIKRLWFFTTSTKEFRRKKDRENEYYLKTTNFHQKAPRIFQSQFSHQDSKKKKSKDRWERSDSDLEYQKIDIMYFTWNREIGCIHNFLI